MKRASTESTVLMPTSPMSADYLRRNRESPLDTLSGRALFGCLPLAKAAEQSELDDVGQVRLLRHPASGEQPLGFLCGQPAEPHPLSRSSLMCGALASPSHVREPSVAAPAALPAADARFMIVACSAFVNWLILKADEAKLLRTRTACPSTPYLALARL